MNWSVVQGFFFKFDGYKLILLLKKLLNTYCLLMFCLMAAGQQAKQYAFTHYSTLNGLSTNYVNNVVQDEKGYMWFATINGLQRYDGNKFSTFKHQPGDPSSIPYNNVAQVYFDKSHNLWVQTADNKLGIFNTVNFRYREIQLDWKPDRKVNFAKALFELSDGTVMLFVGRLALMRFDTALQRFVRADAMVPVPRNWIANSIVYDTISHRFWIAADSGLAVYNPASKNLSYPGHNTDKEKIIDSIRLTGIYNLSVVSPDSLMLMSWQSIYHPTLYNISRKNGGTTSHDLGAELSMGYHELFGVMQQRNGKLWAYGLSFLAERAKGKSSFQLVQNEFVSEQSIKFERVFSMYEDREQSVWICSENGVFFFNPEAQHFTSYNFIRPGETRGHDAGALAAISLTNNQIWLTAWGAGLFCFDQDFRALLLPDKLKPYANYSIWCMLQHSMDEKIWMGLQGGFIMQYDQENGETHFAKPALFEGATVRQVTEDKNGNLWFGTQRGYIIKWDRKASGNRPDKGYTLVEKSRLIHKLFTDNHGYVWAATSSGGLLKIDPESNKIILNVRTSSPPGYNLWDDAPTDIMQYNDSLLLVTGGAINILNLRTNAVEQITTENGLSANAAVCVQKDSKGIVWVGMTNGICRLNLEKRAFTMYDRRDGITKDNFEVAGIFKLSDGRLALATDDNFTVFDPTTINPISVAPPVTITDFRLSNEPLLVDSLAKLKNVSLKYNNNSVVIEFSAMNYVEKNRLRYYYMLEGLDKEWILADERHQAVYTYLPPGSYVFKVRCENINGVTAGKQTVLPIKVRAPFWKTLWFYGFLVLVSIAILYSIDRERVKRLMALQQVRTQIAGNLHKEINTTLNNINLLSEMAKIKADRNIDRSKEYIDQISEKSHNMIIAMDDILWTINPENDSMEKMLLRMREFVDALRNRNDANIEMIVDGKVASVEPDMKSRHEFFLLFKDVLRKMVERSNGTEILIYIDMIRAKLSMKIQDNGFYSDPNSIFNDTEMLDLLKRSDSINAVLDIHADGKGSFVILNLPV
jgi:ligand-binding sensor domain-containing protein/signal transduction histidine kinase